MSHRIIRPTFINTLFSVLYKATGEGRRLLYFLIKIHYSPCNAYKWVLCSYIELLTALYHISNCLKLQWYQTSQLSNQQTTGLHHNTSDNHLFRSIAANIIRDNLIIWEDLQIFWNMNYIINTDAVVNNWCRRWPGNKILKMLALYTIPKQPTNNEWRIPRGEV